MGINLRVYNRGRRLGLKSFVRRTKFIPMLLRPEYGPVSKKNSQKRDIYLKRIGSDNMTWVEKRAYQRMARIRQREERGHRMVSAIYGPNSRIHL